MKYDTTSLWIISSQNKSPSGLKVKAKMVVQVVKLTKHLEKFLSVWVVENIYFPKELSFFQSLISKNFPTLML